MKLKVFYATDGDCLLLSSKDGHHALIDGGRTASFLDQTWDTLQQLALADQALDLVVVSHIDGDHISGILWLMRVVAEWTVHDFQVGEGGNPSFPEPEVARPPTIKMMWHNSWRAQLKELAGPIEALSNQVAEARGPLDTAVRPPAAVRMFDALQELDESIPDGIELMRTVDEATPVPRNGPFKDLVLLLPRPHVEQLGDMSLTVIGPAKKHLEGLREEWRRWLKGTPAGGAGHGMRPVVAPAAGEPVQGLAGDELANALSAGKARREQLIESLAEAAVIIEHADPKRVTPPNRASITLLAEERGRTCLLTGDAAEEEILEGLHAAGRITDGRFSCNVLKVQHHGSEFNLSRSFAETVLADHYVFCSDGAHDNPDPSVVKTIADTRSAADPSPFTLWFNCSVTRTAPTKRKALEAAMTEARAAADAHPDITVRVLDDDKPFFEITV